LGVIAESQLPIPIFLSVRPELKRYQRKGLGYSKDLETHKLAVALHFGVYNFVRKHTTLGTSPAVAAGLEEKPWSLETRDRNDGSLLAAKAAHSEKGKGLAAQACRRSNVRRCAG
jgi:hypothetical protein